jgi:hypothetical protein
MGSKIIIPHISPYTHGVSPVRLSAESVTHPQSCLRHTSTGKKRSLLGIHCGGFYWVWNWNGAACFPFPVFPEISSSGNRILQRTVAEFCGIRLVLMPLGRTLCRDGGSDTPFIKFRASLGRRLFRYRPKWTLVSEYLRGKDKSSLRPRTHMTGVPTTPESIQPDFNTQFGICFVLFKISAPESSIFSFRCSGAE